MQTYIDSLSCAFGSNRQSVEVSFEAGLLTSPPKHLRAAGFAEHRLCDRAQTSLDLALEAVAPIAEVLSEVSVIGYHSGLPLNANVGSEAAFRETREIKHLTDYPASHLQARLGLARANVFGLAQQACTGMHGLVRLARALIVSEPHQGDVLCVTADRLPQRARYEATYNVLSDGAVGCVVSRREGRFRILGAHAITNGAMALVSADEAVGSFLTYSHRMIRELIERCQLGMKDITWVVPQNTARAAWIVLSRLLTLDYAQVLWPSLPDVGHLVSGDNFVNLMREEERQRFRSGDRILLPSAGYGLNWQCLLLERE